MNPNILNLKSGGSVSVLYKKIFTPISKQLNEQLKDDAITVSGLCEWAVTDKRTGYHRALVVAEFLRKRQSALLDHFSQVCSLLVGFISCFYSWVYNLLVGFITR